jgi:CBS domain-containing protein
MTIGEICNRTVVFAHPDESVREAARRMRSCHVGNLVVVEEGTKGRVPVGIITDRDLVLEALATDRDVDATKVGDIMTRDPVTIVDSEDLQQALERMRKHGIRRLPVVDRGKALVGILTLDDVLELVEEQVSDLVQLVVREQRRETEVRR